MLQNSLYFLKVILFVVLEFIKSAYKSGVFLYSKGGYVLGFYTDPKDETGELESVSPSRLFNDQRDEYSRIESASELVKESLKKGI